MKESLIGHKYGRLTVIADGPSIKQRSTSICVCDCGNPNEIIVANKYLKNGDTKSCGCLVKDRCRELQAKDLTGLQFGRLTVIERIGTADDGHSIWRCKCSCGNETTATSRLLSSGSKQSCGCLKKENASTLGKRTGSQNIQKAQEAAKHANKKHGMTKTRLYRIWQMMHQRCENENHSSYQHYGARGITVCDEWFDFNAFSKWALENGYTDELTIDRINPKSGYEPCNCRWISQSDNSARVRDGEHRYWCFSLAHGLYAEFDIISRFLKEHPELNVVPQHVYDVLRGTASNDNDISFGQLE